MKKITRFIALFLATIIIATTLEFPEPVEASVFLNAITGKPGMAALELLERTLSYSLGKASNATENEGVAESLAIAKRFLTGPTSPALAGITDMCEQILEQVTVINTNINANFEHINAQLNNIENDILKQNFNNKYEETREFYGDYSYIYNMYAELVEALEKHSSEQTEESKQNLLEKYTKIEDFYNNPNDEHSGIKFNFDEDLKNFLENISPYPYAEKIDFNKQPSDKSCWGTKLSDAETYMSTYKELIYNMYPFEHQVYDEMKMGINQVAIFINTYLSALRLYTEFGVQQINTNPEFTETERETKVNDLWNTFNERSYRAMRGLEQVISVYGTEISRYMREYDVDNDNFAMDYKSTRTIIDEITSGNFYSNKNEKIFPANKTEKWQSVYSFKPIGSDTSFVVVKSDKSSDENDNNMHLTLGNLVGNKNPDAVLEHDCTTVITDFYNLLSSESPNGYSMIEKSEDLKSILDTNIYKATSKHIGSYLKSQGMTNLPDFKESGNASDYGKDSLKTGSFLLLDQEISKLNNNKNNFDADVVWANITQSLSSDDYSRNNIKLDTDNDIAEKDDVRNSQPLVILKEDKATMNLKLDFNNKLGNASVWSVDENGQASKKLTDSSYECGTRMMIKIKPCENYIVSDITLNSVYNKYKIDLIGNSEIKGDEQEELISTYDVLETIQKDEDGNYCLYFTTPYQDAVIDVDFMPTLNSNINPVVLKKDNTLKGELQFENFSGIVEKEFAKDETVIVYARGYEGNIAENVVVKTTTGKTVKSEKLDYQKYRPTPNTVAFAFIMPDEAVTVTANYKQGFTATLIQEEYGEIAFRGKECWYENWIKNPIAYEENEWVVISGKAKDGYYISNYEIAGLSSYENIKAIPYGNGIAFKMPAEKVNIKPVYTEIVAGKFIVKKDTKGQGIIKLYDKSTALNGAEYHYAPNQSVKFEAIANDGCELIAGTLKAIDSKNNELPITLISGDKYKFKMPASGNVTISADFTQMGTVSTFVPEGVEFELVNEFFKDSENSSSYIAGEKVRVVMHDLPDTYVTKDDIKVSYVEGGETKYVPFEIRNFCVNDGEYDVYNDALRIRVIEFTMPSALDVKVESTATVQLQKITFIPASAASYPICFNKTPVMYESNESAFSIHDKDIKAEFSDVENDALIRVIIKCESFGTSSPIILLPGEGYTLDLKPYLENNTKDIYVFYAVGDITLFTAQSSDEVSLSAHSNTPSARVGTQSDIQQKSFATGSDVRVEAVSSVKDFDVNFNTDVTLESTVKNSNGTYTKTYNFKMPNNNVFADTRVNVSSNNYGDYDEDFPETEARNATPICISFAVVCMLAILFETRKKYLKRQIK